MLSALLAFTTAAMTPVPAAAQAVPADAAVLVLHDAESEAAADAVAALADDGGFTVDTTDDPAALDGLDGYRAVVVTAGGDLLDDDQEAALRAFVEDGGGFVGVHDAATLEDGSDWVTGLIGTRPADSPAEAQEAVVEVGDRVHPATEDLPLEWTRSDVWLNWDPNPSGDVHTVARVRELSYEPGDDANGADHPISWCRDYDGGRSFYTGMGADDLDDELLASHLAGAIQWAAGMVRGDCQAGITDNYEAERLTEPNAEGELDQVGEPHGIDVADDGRVFYIGRGGIEAGVPLKPEWDSPVITDWDDPDIGLGAGTVHVWDPDTEEVTLAGILDVFGNKGGGGEFTKSEEGLLGITLDPDFLDNGWVYLHYTPHSEIDRETHMGERRVSRFTLDHDTNTLDLDSEQVLLAWEMQIHSCCHVGGDMAWDSEGNLYIATGDTNSSRFSGGYSGNNPEPSFMGVSFADARRTAGNTNDYNGKVLRIHPTDDGGYTIPDDNLFTGDEGDGDQTLPEIYVMGMRNPSRLWVDPVTDILYVGWVGPDAGSPSETWGPAKYDQFAAIPEAGNWGWPYCMGNQQPYRDRGLEDPDEPLGWYDCDDLQNTSPNNTGLVDIPPAHNINIWYSPAGGGADFPRDEDGVPSYDSDERFFHLPWLRGGAQAAMGGPVYRYDADSDSDVAWPEYWDGKWFVGDFYFGAQPRHAVLLDPEGIDDGAPPVHAESLKEIIPGGGDGINRLMGWRFGPDGDLYVLDYGGGFFHLDDRSALWRVTYTGGEATPVPTATATPSEGPAPLAVDFSSEGSGGVAVEWDFGDRSPTSTEANPSHTYVRPGVYDVTLTVTYADGEEAVAETRVVAGCVAPDARDTVWFLDTDSGVPNRATPGGCTINDYIGDEEAWASTSRFIQHLGDVTRVLLEEGIIDARERGQLTRAAIRGQIGRPRGPEPYQVLFDGTQESLDDWVMAGPGDFVLTDEGNMRSQGGLGMLWYPEEEFGDFSLRLQFRDVSAGDHHANSGVFVRFPDPRIPVDERPECGQTGPAANSEAWVAIYCGQEIQIYDGPTGEPQKTGSIYNFDPLTLAEANPTPKGEWNDYEIRVEGQQYTIIRNGEVINTFDNSPGTESSRPGDPPTDLRQFFEGFIGLQNHGNADVIEFRNIRVQELSPAAPVRPRGRG